MAESSGPWDDNNGDRTYTAAQVASFWGNMALQDGVALGKLNSLNPTNNGTLTITMDTGYCYKAGVYYYNSASYSLALNACTSEQQHYRWTTVARDRVSHRLDEPRVEAGHVRGAVRDNGDSDRREGQEEHGI